jgi:hypothetical protein
MNRRSTPSSVRWVTHECLKLCGVNAFGNPTASRYATNRALISAGLIRPRRSVTHIAGCSSHPNRGRMFSA